MKQELLELDHFISITTGRVEKMEWIIGHLLNSVTAEDATIVGLLADMVELAKDDLQSIDKIADKLREQEKSKIKDLACLHKIV